jgi:hypothetical protein
MGTDDAKPQGDATKSLSEDPAFKELQKTVRGLALVVQESQKQQTQTMQSFQSMMEKMGTGGAPARKEDDHEVDFDNMSNSDLFQMITKEVGKLLDSKLGEVDKKVTSTRTELAESRVAQRIKEFSSEKKDFWEWADEIKGLAKAHPTLEVRDLYDLARKNDPEKAKTLDEKFNTADTKPKAPFGGLTPTSSMKGVSDNSDEKMSAQDAADKAWDDIMADIPPELLGGSD